MRLLLVRHGETVDNVAGVYAGITDSALTAHGALQAGRLGAHLAARFPSGSVRAVFTSDLQRARRTGGAVRAACSSRAGGSLPPPAPPLHTTPLLRERDFGALEGVPFRAAGLRVDDVAESEASMRARAARFLDEMLLPLVRRRGARADDVYVVVAHGLLLPRIYADLMDRVPWGRLTLDPAAAAAGRAPPLQPWWSNTAYLECLLVPDLATGGRGLRMHVLAVNCTAHLRDLKRTRGGIGSAAHDEKQRSIESYFGGRKM